MSLFSKVIDAMETRAALMGRMMAQLGVGSEEVAKLSMGLELEQMAKRCMFCRHTAACRAWLDGTREGAREFCPNASAFDALLQRH